MIKMALSFAITVFGLLESGDAGFLPRLANDPNYVQISPRRSFYVISVDSGEWRRCRTTHRFEARKAADPRL
jgi:hypothetical protein